LTFFQVSLQQWQFGKKHAHQNYLPVLFNDDFSEAELSGVQFSYKYTSQCILRIILVNCLYLRPDPHLAYTHRRKIE